MIGSRIEGVDTAIHRADYQRNERAIGIGVRAVTRVVLRLLAAASHGASATSSAK